ncbi:hypothetical protein quinque_014429 [Culex quinquefasciatus]
MPWNHSRCPPDLPQNNPSHIHIPLRCLPSPNKGNLPDTSYICNEIHLDPSQCFQTKMRSPQLDQCHSICNVSHDYSSYRS